MERASRTPDDGSDGNDPVSAPSEFLAEFLSAIMQRQYAEALKYCRLILQYEPHNATARGFYSLLQHKVAAAPAAAPPSPPSTPPHSPAALPSGAARGSSSADSSPRHAPPAPRRPRRRAVDMPLSSSHEDMEQEADESASSSTRSGAPLPARASPASPASHDLGDSDDSDDSQSSLELDSSPSMSLSRRTDHTDSAGWESAGTPPSSSGERRDDNGNAPPSPDHRVSLQADDMQNDNDHIGPLKGESSSEALRRLRAQFACSIK